MPRELLRVTDERTGKSYEIPIENGTIKAIDLRQIKVSADDFEKLKKLIESVC